MLVEADDDDCTHIFARELLEVRAPAPPAHRYVAFNIPALLEEVCDDAPPSLAWRMASFALWASGGAIVGTALAVAWSQ